jgi:hypothetical protein
VTRLSQLLRTGAIAGAGLPSPTTTVTTLPEAEWLMSCVASDGALRETPGDVNVRPYMSHYGAIGLARAGEVAGNTTYVDAAWDWLTWYAAHMDSSTGYVNDYHAGSPSPAVDWVDSGAADSTDAYAGMYLTALWLTYYADSGVRYGQTSADDNLALLAASLPLALTAITSTQQVDGLTWALPTYTVKYLEDNIETLVGLRAGSLVADALGNTALKAQFDTAATAMAHGMGYLWNEGTRSWDYAIHEDGGFTRNDWSDENSRRQQIWAAGWGAHTHGTLGTYDSVGLTMDAYTVALPGWSTQTDSFEVMPAWVLFRLGRTTQRDQGVANLEASITASHHAYPWTVATSGMLVFAKYDLPDSLMPFTEGFTGRVISAQLDPAITFPTGANLLPNPTFATDSDSDGRADGLSNYGSPTMTLVPLASGTGNVQRMTVPYDNGWDLRWDPIPVTPGHYYTFSVYRRINALESAGEAVLKYELYDTGGGLVTYGYDTVNTTETTDNRWSLTTFIPPTAVSIRCVIGLNHGGTIDVAYPKLEDSGSATSWATQPGFPSPDAYVPPSALAVHDHLADATAVGTASGQLTWDASGFDAPSEAGSPVGYDGWVLLAPTHDCTVTLSTVGTGARTNSPAPCDTHLVLWQCTALPPNVGSLTQVAADDDSGGAHGGSGVSSWLQAALSGGATYAVEVGAHGGGAPSASMVLNWSGLDVS